MSISQHTPVRGPLPALPTRRVMLPLLCAAAIFAGVIGFNAGESPRFVPLGPGRDGLALQLSDPTPAHDLALDGQFVPASAGKKQRVLRNLDKFARDWKSSSPRISVTAFELSDPASAFARQLDDWLQGADLETANPSSISLLGEVSRSPDVRGLAIRCREQDGPMARALALALAPVVRGDISILYTSANAQNQLDVFIEGEPRFGEAGIAYFPAVDADV